MSKYFNFFLSEKSKEKVEEIILFIAIGLPDTFSTFIKKIDEEEKAEVKKYKGLFANETSGIRKNSLETEYQNVLSSFMKKRVDKTESMIEQTYVFHIFFLLLVLASTQK